MLTRIGCRRMKPSPSVSSTRSGTRGAGSRGVGVSRIRISVSALTRNANPLARNVRAAPTSPINAPLMVGPTSSAASWLMVSLALPSTSRSAGTSRGSSVLYATVNSTVSTPPSPTTAYRKGRVRWPTRAATGRDSRSAARARSHAIISRRLSTRSATMPAGSENSRYGSQARTVNREIWNTLACRVSAASSGTATLVIRVPNSLTVWPPHSSRKFRLRHSDGAAPIATGEGCSTCCVTGAACLCGHAPPGGGPRTLPRRVPARHRISVGAGRRPDRALPDPRLLRVTRKDCCW